MNEPCMFAGISELKSPRTSFCLQVWALTCCQQGNNPKRINSQLSDQFWWKPEDANSSRFCGAISSWFVYSSESKHRGTFRRMFCGIVALFDPQKPPMQQIGITTVCCWMVLLKFLYHGGRGQNFRHNFLVLRTRDRGTCVQNGRSWGTWAKRFRPGIQPDLDRDIVLCCQQFWRTWRTSCEICHVVGRVHHGGAVPAAVVEQLLTHVARLARRVHHDAHELEVLLADADLLPHEPVATPRVEAVSGLVPVPHLALRQGAAKKKWKKVQLK